MAKEVNERYQRASHFADDLRILQQSYRPGSTTSSFHASADAGTGSALRTSASAIRTRTTEVTVAGQAVQNWYSNVRIKDLILGALAVILLVVVAGQSKLFVVMSKFGSNDAVPATNAPVAAPASIPPSRPVLAEDAHSVPASGQNRSRPSLKTAHTSPKQVVVPSSTVDLAIQHQFKDATLYVWVDDKLTLTLPLHGAAQKKLVVFNGVRGVVSETLKVPAGRRTLRFRTLSTDRTTDLSKTLSAEFIGGDTKTLQVSFEKHNSIMRLNWQ
jgi:hypothetical protein